MVPVSIYISFGIVFDTQYSPPISRMHSIRDVTSPIETYRLILSPIVHSCLSSNVHLLILYVVSIVNVILVEYLENLGHTRPAAKCPVFMSLVQHAIRVFSGVGVNALLHYPDNTTLEVFPGRHLCGEHLDDFLLSWSQVAFAVFQYFFHQVIGSVFPFLRHFLLSHALLGCPAARDPA